MHVSHLSAKHLSTTGPVHSESETFELMSKPGGKSSPPNSGSVPLDKSGNTSSITLLKRESTACPHEPTAQPSSKYVGLLSASSRSTYGRPSHKSLGRVPGPSTHFLS